MTIDWFFRDGNWCKVLECQFVDEIEMDRITKWVDEQMRGVSNGS
jgi:hypothetical protein